jgi:hypothetical protein
MRASRRTATRFVTAFESPEVVRAGGVGDTWSPGLDDEPTCTATAAEASGGREPTPAATLTPTATFACVTDPLFPGLETRTEMFTFVA